MWKKRMAFPYLYEKNEFVFKLMIGDSKKQYHYYLFNSMIPNGIESTFQRETYVKSSHIMDI